MRANNMICACVAAFASAAVWGQDLCSVQGKSKMISAGVNSKQIEIICNQKQPATKLPKTDYRNSVEAKLDGQDAKDKSVEITARLIGLRSDSNGPYLHFSDRGAGDIWFVYFEKKFNEQIKSLIDDSTYSFACRIHSFGTANRCILIAL